MVSFWIKWYVYKNAWETLPTSFKINLFHVDGNLNSVIRKQVLDIERLVSDARRYQILSRFIDRRKKINAFFQILHKICSNLTNAKFKTLFMWQHHNGYNCFSAFLENVGISDLKTVFICCKCLNWEKKDPQKPCMLHEVRLHMELAQWLVHRTPELILQLEDLARLPSMMHVCF